MTASSIRSPWGKFSASACSARIDSGFVVRPASEVNADPSRAPMVPIDTSRISPQADTVRQGWTADARASLWVTTSACGHRGPSTMTWAGHTVDDVGHPTGLL